MVDRPRIESALDPAPVPPPPRGRGSTDASSASLAAAAASASASAAVVVASSVIVMRVDDEAPPPRPPRALPPACSALAARAPAAQGRHLAARQSNKQSLGQSSRPASQQTALQADRVPALWRIILRGMARAAVPRAPPRRPPLSPPTAGAAAAAAASLARRGRAQPVDARARAAGGGADDATAEPSAVRRGGGCTKGARGARDGPQRASVCGRARGRVEGSRVGWRLAQQPPLRVACSSLHSCARNVSIGGGASGAVGPAGLRWRVLGPSWPDRAVG
eukprot:scaffold2483_cov287-Prasinococcus_capsulatus_cf.AAC.3